MTIKGILTIVGAGLGLALTPAFGDYVYSTSGCFSGAFVFSGPGDITPACTAAGSTLTFVNGATARDTLTFTDQGSTDVSSAGGTVDLGTFSETNSGNDPGSGFFSNFTLTVNVTDPADASGTPFMAIVSGNMNGTASGYNIDFNQATEEYTAPDGSAFLLTLEPDGLDVYAGGPTVEVVATLTPLTSTVPEPASVGLVGGALVLLGITRRRYSQKA